MALTVTQAAINTAADAYIAAVKADSDVLSAGDAQIFVGVDLGDTTIQDHQRTTTAAGADVSFSTKVAGEHVNDGDFPIQIPYRGGLIPLVWKITNAAEDLT